MGYPTSNQVRKVLPRVAELGAGEVVGKETECRYKLTLTKPLLLRNKQAGC